jgi:hypothetical protein
VPARKTNPADLRAVYLGDHGGSRRARELAEERAELLRLWGSDPWEWVTASDTDGRRVVLTVDPLDDTGNVNKGFPDYDYLRYTFSILADKGVKMLFQDKPRQIMATWSFLVYIDWELRFQESRMWMISKLTRDEAKQFLTDKVKHIHEHLPTWVQQELPVITKRSDHYVYPRTGGQLMAVASNAATRTLRGNTPTGVFIDEAAFQDEFREMVSAAIPTNCRLLATSSANSAGAGARYAKEIMGVAR